MIERMLVSVEIHNENGYSRSAQEVIYWKKPETTEDRALFITDILPASFKLKPGERISTWEIIQQ
jgi:hypothetical protein